MSTSRPQVTPITDESKFQEKTINGVKIKFAQHEDNKCMYTVKIDGIAAVVSNKDGSAMTDEVLAECVEMLQQQKEMAILQMIMNSPEVSEEQKEELMFMMMLKQNPQLAQALMGLGAPAANGPASPGTSRFGLNFGGGAPMNFGSDNSEDFRPRSPGL